jgi:hypothetical protein
MNDWRDRYPYIVETAIILAMVFTIIAVILSL